MLCCVLIPIIYSEISIGFSLIENLESAIAKAGFQMLGNS